MSRVPSMRSVCNAAQPTPRNKRAVGQPLGGDGEGLGDVGRAARMKLIGVSPLARSPHASPYHRHSAGNIVPVGLSPSMVRLQASPYHNHSGCRIARAKYATTAAAFAFGLLSAKSPNPTSAPPGGATYIG